MQEYIQQATKLIQLYLNNIKDRLSPKTINNKTNVLNKFCSFIYNEIIDIDELTVEIVQKYIETKSHLKAKSLHTHLCIIIQFLRFLAKENLCKPYIHTSILKPTIWKYAELPYALPWEIVEKMPVVKIPKETCVFRNRAILLLIITYGFRAGEICALKTTDIDWNAGTIEVDRSKNYVSSKFPLDVDVGNAIVEYLQCERKNGKSKFLFLHRNSSTKQIGTHSIWNIVNIRLRVLGYSFAGKHGAHAIRHSVAQHLLDNGISYKEVRDILGHKHLSSTLIYAKINFNQLKKAALCKINDLLEAPSSQSQSFFQQKLLNSPINFSITKIGDLL